MEEISCSDKNSYSDNLYREDKGSGSALYGSRSTERVSTPKRNALRDLVVLTGIHNLRELWDWARCQRVRLPSVQHIESVLTALNSYSRTDGLGDATDSPIFLLATGWRSGSTLLQRILVTDPSLLLWGEPLGEMAIVSGIADMLTRLSTFPDLSRQFAASDEVFSSLSTSWIATLYPPGGDLRSALAMLFDRWLAQPARKRGFGRWGFKEVRLGATEAVLLHWLYPKARFLLLSRDPYDCYRSLSDSGWHHLYYRRPDIRVDSAAGLARHWNRLALSWSELPANFPCFHIKYEDLIGRRIDFRALESWLGVRLNEQVALDAFVGSTARRKHLGLCERAIIAHEAAAGMRALGYLPQQ